MMMMRNLSITLMSVAVLTAVGCDGGHKTSRFCFGDGLCIEPDGRKVLADGQPVGGDLDIGGDGDSPGGDTVGGDGDGPGGDTVGGDGDSGGDTGGDLCSCPVTSDDNDGDCIPNNVEDLNGNNLVDAWVDANTNNCFDAGDTAGESDPNNPDSDGDGIRDGCEDRNLNGRPDASIFESLAFAGAGLDSDCDGIPDNLEDKNLNGRFEPSLGETNSADPDSDRDGIPDGIEDTNHNGVVEPYIDNNANGCFDSGDVAGESNPSALDSDGDGIADNIEDKNLNGNCDSGETCAWLRDTDCDGLHDGIEDANHNGVRNSNETNPLNPDSDGDGLLDGVEDADHDGFWDVGFETNPRLVDTDGDNITDGAEDANLNGVWDAFVDTNGNGCWDDGEPAGETDPRQRDTDRDGIFDNFEDRDQDGLCRVEFLPDPLHPQNLVRTFLESCAFLSDTDCDGLSDGTEDNDLDGVYEPGNWSNPLLVDTDHDGLADGAEDADRDGVRDQGETDIKNPDTDGDGLPDGIEVNFSTEGCNTGLPCVPVDPLREESDGDGIADGEEDLNRNGIFEPSLGETDPRRVDPPPTEGTLQRAEFEVCATQNLKRITFAQGAADTHDYKLAFEVERQDVAGTTCSLDSQCNTAAKQTCQNGRCVLESEYFLSAYGRDNNQNGFNPNDLADELLGHIFQSSAGVTIDSSTNQAVNRNIYGFLLVQEKTEALDTILDDIRGLLAADAALDVEQVADLTSRPAHDSLTNFRINFAQRIFKVRITPQGGTSAFSSLHLRNLILSDDFLGGEIPSPALPVVDPVYGNIVCTNPQAANCHTAFTVYVSTVQRLDQDGGNGDPVVITVVGLTPGTSDQNDPAFFDRASRLEDLTGGSALARFSADIGKVCEPKQPNQAVADLLWVVDDSRSMQQIIQRLQQAARDAQAVLTANSNIVDFRVAMTTTNPSEAGRTLCPDSCDASCGGPSCSLGSCADLSLGCIKTCPGTCDASCLPGGCATGALCNGSCVPPGQLATAIDAEINNANESLNYRLPGGGGNFYFEDTAFLDCNSSPTAANAFVDSCGPGTPYAAEFAPFYGGQNRQRFLSHAGFLSSDVNADCMQALMDLSADASAGGTSCFEDAEFCCERLTEACSDGPTVLASQMCNLIREMGGRPGPTSSGTRPYSAPENGSRSARRLIDKMLPALPTGYSPSDATCPGLNPAEHLRLRCNAGEPGCTCCDPRTDADCDVVPLVTLFLSDEEDFFFKDDCSAEPFAADRSSLAPTCYDVDGDPNTPDECTVEYCEAATWAPSGRTRAFRTGVPTGYTPDTPDLSTAVNFSFSWRDPGAPECSPLAADADVSCVGDPCQYLTEAECGCDPNDTGCTAGASEQYNFCWWDGGSCRNQCSYRVSATSGTLAAAQAACEDPDNFCRFDRSLITVGSRANACVMRRPVNDCQPCKRLLRTREAIDGGFDEVRGGDLAGLSITGGSDPKGRVYSIIRDLGVGGFGDIGQLGQQDPCGGGSITWGRGDGRAYRDLSIGTLGRTQDVCATSYRDFMQIVISDIAVLSAPYKLLGRPIAATIKVGLGRPLPTEQCPGGVGPCFESIIVPRSRSQGFFYDATSNSLGFKSDPVDTDNDGQFSTTEILAARNAPIVPKDGDIVFVSYRFWKPVPCAEQCADDQTCARVICIDEGGSSSCPGGLDAECPAGQICNAGLCILDCTPGELVDVCIDDPQCDRCEQFNTDLRLCVPIADSCQCNPNGGQTCDPTAPNSCFIGSFCGEGCVCESIPSCNASTGNCNDALACCMQWDQAQLDCEPLDSTACAAAPDCVVNSAGGCDYQFGTCCGTEEVPQCFADAETGDTFLFCEPAACTCSPSCGPNESCKGVPGGGCACFLNPG
ncbi:MAG: hypothetical protein R3C68_14530 [Myxococcota bacterium]